ncbi:DUF58 domain-containing protein [Demequina salsinemoris]|uniref:DUF58 domain-containing protein n=1 Tax=Demequina salsinemoris TaxID=577470 RepID=UPI000785CC23|nr:DUF58 domain-containing protein [Demequina salsinemoris]
MTSRGTATARTAPTASRPGRTETVVTARGIGMAGAGVALLALGIGLASTMVAFVGLTVLAATGISAVWILGSVQTLRRRYRSARRVVAPFPLVVGEPGAVTVDVDALHATRRVPLLDIREQAAPELTGPRPTSAEVLRAPGRVRLAYALRPDTRGRWPLGPAIVRVADPFGLAWADTPVGAEELVPVRPQVVDLGAAGGARLDGLEQLARGARRASADDAAVREYRTGDDPRRVHWPSTARRGSLVVRADEHSGRPPATLLLDLPGDADAVETAVSAAASVALSVVADGHGLTLAVPGESTVSTWGAEAPDEARAGILDACVDLRPGDAESSDSLARSAHELLRDDGAASLVIALVEPRGERDPGIVSLSGVGAGGRAIALVRAGDHASDTRRALARGGWHCAIWNDLGDLPDAWASVARGTGTV